MLDFDTGSADLWVWMLLTQFSLPYIHEKSGIFHIVERISKKGAQFIQPEDVELVQAITQQGLDDQIW